MKTIQIILVAVLISVSVAAQSNTNTNLVTVTAQSTKKAGLSLTLTDGYLRELWNYLQSQKQYKDKTTILITTDHGRGLTPADWSDHGDDVEGAQYIWLATISPDSSLRGEWRNTETIYQDQIAATLYRFLN